MEQIRQMVRDLIIGDLRFYERKYEAAATDSDRSYYRGAMQSLKTLLNQLEGKI